MASRISSSSKRASQLGSLKLGVDNLISTAIKSDADALLQLIESVKMILSKEKREGGAGRQRVAGGLVSIPPIGRAAVVGDLHGDLESLSFILRDGKFLEKLKKEDWHLIFLGDYIDRGPSSPEVCYTVLKVKEMFQERVILLLGNHEGPWPVVPHEFPFQLIKKYGDRGEEIYGKMMGLFEEFYHAAIVEERYLLLHGGVPSETSSLNDLASSDYLEEILWSDPRDGIVGVYPSPRGAGMLFGEDVTERVLKALGVKMLIRSHEPCHEGIRIDHGGKVLTVFSRRGPPYYNAYGAYLTLDLSKEEDAEELGKKAQKF